MNRGAPESHGWSVGAAITTVGRATRFACTPHHGADATNHAAAGEIWRMDADAEPIARRLLALGARGVGLFTAGGVDHDDDVDNDDGDGVWLWRATGYRTLAALLAERGQAPMPWRQATELVVAIARAAAACEAESLFPGALAPARIALTTEAGEPQAGEPQASGQEAMHQKNHAHLTAESLVHALVGADSGSHESSIQPSAASRWLPPEQAAGAPWDNAANRYVIGLIWYRLLAGVHPFSGAGLRSAFADSAQRGVPPLPESVARELPPGMHSAVCRALDPQPGERPASARDLAQRAHSFLAPAADTTQPAGPSTRGDADALRALREHRAGRARRDPRAGGGQSERAADESRAESRAAAELRAESRPAAESRAESRAAAKPEPRAIRAAEPRVVAPKTGRAVLLFGAPALAAILALGSLLWFSGGNARSADTAATPAASHVALTPGRTDAAACAGCHPRHVAEWRRSIMAHAGKSPLFQALEMLIEEQAGKSFACPGGAGVLRQSDPGSACRAGTGFEITGSGGPLWCANCHTPATNLAPNLPPWNGVSATSASRQPLRDLLPEAAMEGISCAFCHQVDGPVQPGVPGYSGNPFWTSVATGQRFAMRPEDRRGLFGIANSGYRLNPVAFLLPATPDANQQDPLAVRGGAHRRATDEARRYLRSSEFCGACHDVRLFGTDVIGARLGEHFKRLRNAYTEWAAWRDLRTRTGRDAFTCQDCHMSEFPGVCAPAPDDLVSELAPDDPTPDHPVSGQAQDPARVSLVDSVCPTGTRFVERAPGSYPVTRASAGSERAPVTSHYFSGVDIPLAPDFDPQGVLTDDSTLDATGIPLGARQRRDLLLGRSLRFDVAEARALGDTLEIAVELENIGAGHRVPAGFSQEREIWVHMRVTDARGVVVYEVGRVDRDDQDLRDKIFQRINTDEASARVDAQGQPLGLFGADIVDGPDHPEWLPPPNSGARAFRGKGLINLQNGFLRCVRCIGELDGQGRCQPGPGQGFTRADRFDDGAYDPDTGQCLSNLVGDNALFEVYFPVGSLDASRGVIKGPDAIVDTRSLAPEAPVRYTYELPVASAAQPPFTVQARLLFRAFPPFLLRGFADYEAAQAQRGARPSGPLITRAALERLEVVELAVVTVITPAVPAPAAQPPAPAAQPPAPAAQPQPPAAKPAAKIEAPVP